MADDIDVGIGVHVNADAQQVVDQLRTKLAALRSELAQVSAAQNDFNGGSTQSGATASANAAAAAANSAIGAFVRMGQVVDATNAEAVKAFREEGDAISAYLVKLGATDPELNRIGASIAKLEQRAGASRITPIVNPIPPIPGATIETYDKIPGKARTAANAFSLLALAASSGTGSVQGMAVAAGGLATGLSGLAGAGRLAAAASGIGTVVTVLAVVIELLHRGTEATQKQQAALKSFTETNESFAARSRAVADAISFLSQLPGNNAAQIQIIGITKAVDELDKALIKAKADLKNTVNTPSFTQLQAAEAGDTATEELAKLSKELQALRTRFADNKLTVAQFNTELKRIGENHPSFSEEIAQTASLAANYDRLREARAKEGAAALQQIAIEQQTKLAFGLTPDLAKALDEVNQQFAALHSGGAVALQSVQDQQKSIRSATDAWKQYVTSVEGSRFATVTFDQAITKRGAELKKLGPELQTAANAKANSLLQTATAVIQTQRQVESGVTLADLARTQTEKAAQAVLARTQGEAAARRKAADDEFDQGKRQLARMAGLETDRTRVAVALERQHTEAIRRIDKEESDKVTALLASLSGERIAAEAKLSDDEFGARRAAAQRQFDADKKRITDAKLSGQQETDARTEAARKLTATLAGVEKDRTERLREIDTSARQQIDELTSRTGDVDEAKVRAGFKKQLDVLAATIASADTTDVEKALARQGQRDIETLIPLEIAKARMAELEKVITAAAMSSNAAIGEATALLDAHAITQSQARDQIVAALIRERDTVAASLPLLKAQADNLPGNEEAQAKLDAYRLKLLELNLTIAKTSDQFFQLKEAGRDATQTALANLFVGATKLGAQDKTEINALAAQLSSARRELEQLLAIPTAKRTAEENDRISELRNEVERTTVSLNTAKSSITTWRDLFIDAAQSIVDALVKVAAQMLATSLLEKALSLSFGFGGGSAASGAEFSTANLLAPPFAGGGRIGGRGGPTSDANLIAASRDEFVLPAASNYLYGFDVAEGLRRRIFSRDAVRALLNGIAPMTLKPRRSISHFAEGGLVTAGVATAPTPATDQAFTHTFEFRGLPAGTVVDHIDSPAGHRVLIKVIRERSRSIRAALGST